MTVIAFSVKQMAILKAIKDKRSDGDYCDIYDLMENLPYKVKRDALRHSLKILIDGGFVQALPRVKRTTRTMTVTPFTVTASGYAAV